MPNLMEISEQVFKVIVAYTQRLVAYFFTAFIVSDKCNFCQVMAIYFYI